MTRLFSSLTTKKFLLLIFLSTFFLHVFSQSTVSGLITNGNTEEPVDYAAIGLVYLPDSALINSTITDSYGNYSIEITKTGKYCMHIRSLGYKNFITEPFLVEDLESEINIDDIILEEEKILLNEVVVNSDRLVGESLVDKTVYSISSKVREVSKSGLDVLMFVPSVQVDVFNKTVKLNGSNNIQFQVDGKDVESNYIKQIPPERIARVEIMDQPSAKYDASISGVINIILMKDKRTGLNGRISTENHYSNFRTDDVFGQAMSYYSENIEYGFKKLRLYSNVDGGIDKFQTSSDIENIYSDGSGYHQTSIEESCSYPWVWGEIGADWFINNKNMLNMSIELSPGIPEKSIAEYEIDTLSGDLQYLYSESSSTEKYYSPELYYKRKFDKKGQELTIQTLYKKRTTQNNDESSYANSGNQYKNKVESLKDNSATKIDYTHPVGDFKIETGFHQYLQWFNNTLTDETNSVEKYKYSEYRNAVYLNLVGAKEKLKYQAGIRYEHSGINLNDQKDKDINLFSPQVSFVYKFSEIHDVKLSYRRQIRRCMFTDMLPFETQTDDYNVSIGNPDLDPEQWDNFNLKYSLNSDAGFFVSTGLYAQLQKDKVVDIKYLRNDGVTVSTYENIGSAIEKGVRLDVEIFAIDWWECELGGSVYNLEFESLPDYDIEGKKALLSDFYCSNIFMLPADFSVITDFYYESGYISLQSVEAPYTFYMAGINKSFGDNIEMGLTWYLLFNSEYIMNDTKTTTNDFVLTEYSTFNLEPLISFDKSVTFGNAELKKVRNDQKQGEGGKSPF